MTTPLESIVQAGSKLWLDSVDPDLIASNFALGASGATSNPIIISDLVKSGRYDQSLAHLLNDEQLSAHDAAWKLNDQVVAEAQQTFLPIWKKTAGNDGYVSFELNPLLEDPEGNLPHADRVSKYIAEGVKWSEGHDNRMIKVPATPAGLESLEELAALGVPLNVTLVFSMRQYQEARDAIWRGAQRLPNLDRFKSVYSIFVSRVDVYTEKHVPQLSPAAQGMVGILNAKEIWRENQGFWELHQSPLQHEIVFASTGTKKPGDPPWKYVEAFVGSDIQTNPPATNAAVEESGRTFARSVDQFPPEEVVEEIHREVDIEKMEAVLIEEGIQKFADPQKALLQLVEERAASLAK